MTNLRLTRYIPEDATEVAVTSTVARCRAVVYIFEQTTKAGTVNYLAKTYIGAKKKQYSFYRYLTPEQRQEAVDRFISIQQAESDQAEARKAVVNDFKRDVEVGDILHSSWGYDQTQSDFYQITELVGKKSVKFREIASNKTYDHSMSGTNTPIKDEFIGGEYTKQYGIYGAKLSSFETARKWDGRPKHWSSYA
jgi:hypothetical protein